MAKIDIKKAGVIDVDLPVSPAILAGLLGISEQMVYQGRQSGKLPPESDASYRASIIHYIEWHKKRSNSKASSMAERKMLQEIRNGLAKEEMQWLDIKEKRGLLLDKAEMAQVVEPIFHLVKSGLVNLAREHPDIQTKVDKILSSWSVLGEKMVSEADMDANRFVSDMLELDVDDGLEKTEGFPDAL